jgi:hypothetical protein
MSAQLDKSLAHQLIDQLPNDATWEDLLYEIYAREEIEAGIKDADEGRLLSVADVRRRLGLPA